MDSLRQDLRFAIRSLLRRRTFAAVAILTIGLSIGASTSIFSVVDGVLFRSLPYHDANRIVAVWQTVPNWRKEPILASKWDHVVIAYDDFIHWRAKQTSFTAVGAWTGSRVMLSTGDQPEQVGDTRASPSLFDVLGVKPFMGRTFLPGEDIVNGPRVTVLSHDAWLSRFGGRRDVLGQTVLFDSIAYRIVGVLPAEFTLVRGQAPTPFFIPAGQQPNDIGHSNHNYRAIARLKPGVTIERAASEAKQLLGASEATPVRGIHVLQYQLDQTRDVRAPLLLLLGAVGLLVLVACLNVATLLLGEAASREQEMGARVALGATRGRLIRQLLTESTLLSAAGGAVGVLLAWWMTKALVAIAPSRIPGIQMARVDSRVLAATIVVAAVTGVLFGLAPALTLSRARPTSLLLSRSHSARGRARLQRIMIAAELALSVVLLVGAGLVSQSLKRLTAVEPGFRTDHLLMIHTAFPAGRHGDEIASAKYSTIFERLRAVPGVTAVTAGGPVPFDGNYSSSYLQPESEVGMSANSRRREAQQRVVVSNFFSVIGIPILSGRAFGEQDQLDAPLVAIVSEALARRDWPMESPIGKRIRFQGAPRTIVGIVGDTKVNRLNENGQATIYTPEAQRMDGLEVLVRTRGDPLAMVPAVRRALGEVAPSMPITAADAMDDKIRESIGEERFRTTLIDLFGVMAAVLAGVGMYGVTSRAVSRREREVGIRVALGATGGSVIRMIVGSTLAGVAAGVTAGVAASMAASQLLAPYLFGVSAHDPTTYGAILLLLALISVGASWAPARRAGLVAPATVLRSE